jgi:hypothetical protein
VNVLTRNVSSRRGSLLEFKPVAVVDGDAVQMWAAADSEYAFIVALTNRFLVEAGGGEETV